MLSSRIGSCLECTSPRSCSSRIYPSTNAGTDLAASHWRGARTPATPRRLRTRDLLFEPDGSTSPQAANQMIVTLRMFVRGDFMQALRISGSRTGCRSRAATVK